jgi:NAD-dependent DNA ligase
MKNQIEIPAKCPSCEYSLELVNQQLFCRNSACPAQSNKKIEAYAKKMKIKGLGPKTIEKLQLESIGDLYTLSLEYFREIIGNAMAEKLDREITASLNTPFATFLAALSIPLIGDTASKKIATVVNSIEDITEKKLIEAGIGEKARSNLLNWIATSYVDEGYNDIPVKFTTMVSVSQKGTVCITGKLNNFKNRDEAAKHLESLGYTVVSGVTGKTKFLVDEEGKPSSKRKKAEQLNIQIVTIKQLEDN